MQQLFANDPALLRIKIRQLELLSLLRGEAIQKIIIQEEQKMPVHIDIIKDLRYQQGVKENNLENAKKMLENGIDVLLVQNITGLSKSKLEDIVRHISKK